MVPENSKQIHCTYSSSATLACAKFDIYNASIFTIRIILSPYVAMHITLLHAIRYTVILNTDTLSVIVIPSQTFS